MTERLYYHDPYLLQFASPLVGMDADRRRIRLRETAFYPASGGQPHDTGVLAGIPVTDVVEDDGEIVHVLDRALDAEPGTVLEGVVDRERRVDHMQQHTGQHLLSAVFVELFGHETLSFHMGSEVSTIELAAPSLDLATLEAVEMRCNELIAGNRPVRVSFEDAASAEGLRKESSRQGLLRIVTIDGLDRSACGGTHVRSLCEVGCVLLRGTERIRGNTRLSFVCGGRAVRRARADYNALSQIARTLSAAVEDVPGLVSGLVERTAAAEKERARLARELAGVRGRELHARTEPLASGLRVAVREYADLGEETRAEARAFADAGRAVLIGFCLSPPSVLVAASADSGFHAGNALKQALAATGGRGGGSATAAQGSTSDARSARRAAAAIEEEIRRTEELR